MCDKKNEEKITKTRFFSFYLPQFHEIKENNIWWGDGFTEWSHVKKANKLFNGHIQPIHPLDNRYYNLLDKKTVIWQNDLMKKYGIDGLIYYHYYFKGDLLLEKPAENLLKWKEIDQNFFFCWANHDWIKNGKILLKKQEYGNKTDWEKHFDYLLPFFKDERYEKKDNKPLLMLFKGDFKEKNEIIDFFDQKCKENGFNGIYYIETVSFNGSERKNIKKLLNGIIEKPVDCLFFREPSISHALYDSEIHYKFFFKAIQKLTKYFYKLLGKKYIYKFEAEMFYRKMMQEPLGDTIIHGLFFSWDNTPRHGENGYVIFPPSKDTVFTFLNNIKESEYVFINAWNEWAEGMVLEPSLEYGYRYLEWIKEWKNNNSVMF